MAVSEKGARTGGGSSGLALIYDERVRSVFYQIVTFSTVAWLAWYLVSNTSANLAARGMSSGFDFLFLTAGFDTDFKLISYEVGDTYGRIFLIGILNTLFVSLIAIVLTTFLGFFVGIMRLSSNWLVSKLASAYVEILRNTPLLLQIIFWYLGVFALLPRPKQSYDLFGAGFSFLNNRGFYSPSPIFGELFWASVVALIVAIVAVVWLKKWAHKRQDETGEQFPTIWIGLAVLVVLPLATFYATGAPLDWEVPALKGFNFQGGFKVPPAFLALLVALTIYHSSYLAESVRAGIQSVHKGQTEAAYSLGHRPGRTLRLVVIPQAMRAIIPPLISLWMNVVKNSSLAVAIGYPDVVALFMQTSLNQSGYAIEIVAMTMLFYMTVSLSISGLLNVYNKRVQIRER
ncbi:MAG: amino acid ABC transporter permease [Alphaproteobacteria bacterium]|jgi:general L-amino acid transport system permease protein|nr:amino acid ABC transporter permease [Alphaproteobacteria bacterium]